VRGLQKAAGNVIKSVEEEVPFYTLPQAFAEKAGIHISVEQSKAILKSLGINLPARIRESELTSVLRTLNMSNAQISQYITLVRKLKS
jgi:hypothetical protein